MDWTSFFVKHKHWQLVFFIMMALLAKVSYSKDLSLANYCIKNGNDSFNCSSLIRDMEQNKGYADRCDTGYWKIVMRIKKVELSTLPCAEMRYNVTCLTAEEKQIQKVKDEICELIKNKIIPENATPKIQQSNHTDSGSIKIEDQVSVTTTPKSRAKAFAVAVVKPIKSKIKAVVQNNVDLYNDYYLSLDLSIVVISLMGDKGETINETVAFDINTTGEKSVKNLPSTQQFTKISKICMMYQSATETTAAHWTDNACKTVVKNNQVSCACDHNSAFAVVFSTRNVTLPQAVTTASVVMETLSIIFLAITIVLLGIYRKRMRNFDRVLVQINLCLALLLTHLFFVLASLAVEVSGICYFMALATHFFLVSTAVLMVMEGTLMMTKVLFPHAFTDSSSKKKRRIIGFCIAWVLPLIYAIVCGAVRIPSGTYVPKTAERNSYEKCWIAQDYAKYVVIIPICLALGINLIISIRLGLLVWSMSRGAEKFKPSNLRDQNKASHAIKALRAVLFMMPILGIPWILGLLVNIEPMEVVFGSIHVIVNGLQGLLLFIHYALFNEEMRGALKKMWSTSVSALPTVHFTSKSRSDSQAGLQD